MQCQTRFLDFVPIKQIDFWKCFIMLNNVKHFFLVFSVLGNMPLIDVLTDIASQYRLKQWIGKLTECNKWLSPSKLTSN